MSLNDPVAERGAIAGCCKSRENYLDVCDILKTESFNDTANSALWNCISTIYEDEKPPDRIDIASLISVANTKGFKFLFEKKAETELVRRALDMDIEPVSVRKFSAKVRKLHILRQAANLTDSIGENIRGLTGNESIDNIFSVLQNPVLDFSNVLYGNDGTIKRIGENAEQYIEYRLANPVERMGIGTGFKIYDNFIGGGVRPNSVNVIAARNKEGKSQLCANMGTNIAFKGFPSFLLDTEMSEEEQLDRILGRIANIPVSLIEKGYPGHTPEIRKQLVEAARKLRDMPLYYKVIRDMEFEEVLALIRRWLFKDVGMNNGKAKPGVIVYDYLKLLNDKPISKQMAEYQALGFMMTGLKNFVGRYGVGSLVTAQTNREGIEGENDAVVAGSDRIGWFCTSLSLYKSKTKDEIAEAVPTRTHNYTHKLITLLTRWGTKLDQNDYINIEGDYKIAKVKEGPTAFEISKRLLLAQNAAPAAEGGESEQQDSVNF